ncbi:hypothetical protein KZ309_25875, partial [Escherichia coli]|nr:hypothetical protein [Escherichia coli]
IDEEGNKPAPTGTPEPAEALATAAPVASEEPGPLVGSGPTADASHRRQRVNRPAPSESGKRTAAVRAESAPAALADQISRRAQGLG